MEHIPGPARRALERLNRAGFEAYLVGGCVRDSLMGRVPGDWDITTSALPEETKQVFAEERLIETGLKHGTVTVLLEEMPLEITTFRVEAGYSDNRHPDAVRFTRSLREDLVRRDFTVNAMALSADGQLYDYFGGREDLSCRVLRCVGDADKRFQEDGLRLLRALRFASVLDFSIAPETQAAIHRNRSLLNNISAERIFSELKKLLIGPRVEEILTEYPDVLGVFLPEILPCVGFDQKNPHHCYDIWVHIVKAIAACPADPQLRLAALFHDLGKPPAFSMDDKGIGHFYGHAKFSEEYAAGALLRLKADRETTDRVTELVRLHDTPVHASPAAVKRLLNRIGEEQFFRLLQLQRADNLAQAPEYLHAGYCEERTALAREILTKQECFSLKDLAVSGKDLIAAGIRPSPAMGQLLQRLLEAVIDGKAENRKEPLLAAAMAWNDEA